MSENAAPGYPQTDWPVGNYARDFFVGLMVCGGFLLLSLKVLLTASVYVSLYYGDMASTIPWLTMSLLDFSNWLAWNGFTLTLCLSLPLAALFSNLGPQPARRRRAVRVIFWVFLSANIGLLLGLSYPVLTLSQG